MQKRYFSSKYLLLFLAANCSWLQNGYKNFENTEKINIFSKCDDTKPRKHAICHARFPNLIREGGRTVGSGRVATIIE